MKRLFFTGLLFVLTFFVQTSTATLAPMLPESSYEDGHWQGFRFFDEEVGEGEYLRGRVDYAVYDTQNLQNTDETNWIGSLELSGEGQFLYAYQVFDDYEGWSDREVSSFSVFSMSGGPLDVDEDSIDSVEDDESGVEAADGFLTNSDTQVLWNWEPEPGGYGYVNAGEHSWFLLFLSDLSPVVGDFEVQISEQQGDIPTPGVPEPATVALLGLGYTLIVLKRKKFRVKH